MYILLYCCHIFNVLESKKKITGDGDSLVSMIISFLPVFILLKVGWYIDMVTWLENRMPIVDHGRSLDNPFILLGLFISFPLYLFLKKYFKSEKIKAKQIQYFKNNKLSLKLHGIIAFVMIMLVFSLGFAINIDILPEEWLNFLLFLVGFEIWLGYEFEG